MTTVKMHKQSFDRYLYQASAPNGHWYAEALTDPNIFTILDTCKV